MLLVSTHSRPKAAGGVAMPGCGCIGCFNTQPPEGGWLVILIMTFGAGLMFQHTAARRRLAAPIYDQYNKAVFQHTAARRRLVFHVFDTANGLHLFQHTAARRRLHSILVHQIQFDSFNTQPPEGGWSRYGT